MDLKVSHFFTLSKRYKKNWPMTHCQSKVDKLQASISTSHKNASSIRFRESQHRFELRGHDENRLKSQTQLITFCSFCLKNTCGKTCHMCFTLFYHVIHLKNLFVRKQVENTQCSRKHLATVLPGKLLDPAALAVMKPLSLDVRNESNNSTGKTI